MPLNQNGSLVRYYKLTQCFTTISLLFHIKCSLEIICLPLVTEEQTTSSSHYDPHDAGVNKK